MLSWWDYGYQINGVANRTSIADGNTWNHEHIALLGRVLISPEVCFFFSLGFLSPCVHKIPCRKKPMKSPAILLTMCWFGLPDGLE